MAVRFVKGVEKVDVNSEDKTVTVTFDLEVVTPEAIMEAMARIGYEAQEIGVN